MNPPAPSPAVAQCAEEHGIDLIEPATSRHNQVWFGERRGVPVVLKYGEELARRREAEVLGLLAARAAERDRWPFAPLQLATPSCVVVQRILPGDDLLPTASSSPLAAYNIAVATCQAWHQIARQVRWEETNGILGDFADELAVTLSHAPSVLQPMAAQARALLDGLRQSAAMQMIHADCHLQNIIRDAWNAPTYRLIDPHGAWGDPAADFATLLLHMHHPAWIMNTEITEQRHHLQVLVAMVQERTDLKISRLLSWVKVLAAVWEIRTFDTYGFTSGLGARMSRVVDLAEGEKRLR